MRIARGVAVILLAVLAGCGVAPSTPERRAQQYVELLLRQPPDAAEQFAALASPEPTLDGVATEVALDYLRARLRQDAEPEITPTTTRKSADGRRTVIVSVSPGPGRAAEKDRVRFAVLLERDPERGWQVRSLRVE